jgi:hypothetical protein
VLHVYCVYIICNSWMHLNIWIYFIKVWRINTVDYLHNRWLSNGYIISRYPESLQFLWLWAIPIWDPFVPIAESQSDSAPVCFKHIFSMQSMHITNIATVSDCGQSVEMCIYWPNKIVSVSTVWRFTCFVFIHSLTVCFMCVKGIGPRHMRTAINAAPNDGLGPAQSTAALPAISLHGL